MPSSPLAARLTGFIILIAVAALDQWSKAWVLSSAYSAALPHDILPFFSLVLVRNHGISFGLFAGGQASGAHLLTFITSLVAITLVFWLARVRELWVALALGPVG